MKLLIGTGLVAALLTSGASAQKIPFNPVPLNTYTGALDNGNFARLKLSVGMENVEGTPSLNIGGIVLCSKLSCYRPVVNSTFSSSSTKDGRAQLLIDSVMPYSQIETVFFEDLKGANVAGSVTLARGLNVEKGYYGGEIFVVLRADSNSKNIRPTFATSSLMREGGKSIFYNPKFPLAVSLENGASFSLPAGALANPEIFNVQVHDTGEDYPLLDIYPYVNLLKSASVGVQTIPHSTHQRTQTIPVQVSPIGNISQIDTLNLTEAQTSSKKLEAASTKVERNITRTGLFKSAHFRKSEATSMSTMSIASTAASATAPTCADYLNFPENKQKIANAVAVNGIANINWCEQIPPYIHIIYAKTTDSRVHYRHDFRWEANPKPPYGSGFHLTRITSLSPNASAAMNGFMWSGDEGTGDPQWGQALGYYVAGAVRYGGNVPGGGNYTGSSSGDGNKFIMTHYRNLATNPVFNQSSAANYSIPNEFYTLSSSTSIYKFGNCSGDTLNNRWSAIGAGPGIMVMTSSTSDGETNASQLCPIFTALGATGALRMDGGPSASMVIGGKLVNPLTGLASFKYGSMRYIAYSINLSGY